MKQYDDAELKRLGKAVGWNLTFPPISDGTCVLETGAGGWTEETARSLARTLAAELRRLAEDVSRVIGIYHASKFGETSGYSNFAMDYFNNEAASLEAWAKEQEKPKVEQHGRVVRTNNNLSRLRCMECGQPVKMWVCPTCQQSVRKE